MLINYVLVISSTALFAVNMICNKFYQKNEGSGFYKALLFALLTSLFGSIFMFFVSGLSIDFTWFSFALALLQAVMSIVSIFASLKAFNRVNLSLYTLFMMSGGMILPFVYGIIVGGEQLTPIKVICLLLMLSSLFISCGKITDLKGLFYCIIMFFINGSFSIIATVHQSYPDYAVSGSQFSLLFYTTEFIISLILFAVVLIKNNAGRSLFYPQKPLFSLSLSFFYVIFNGTGNLFLLEALKRGFDASLQYPLVTGGVMIFNTIASLFIGENVKKSNWISVIISFVGLLLLCL